MTPAYVVNHLALLPRACSGTEWLLFRTFLPLSEILALTGIGRRCTK